MSTRTTQAELDGAFYAAARAARESGLFTAGWHVQGGSKANGVQYVLVMPAQKRTLKLGLTKTDAWFRLDAMRVALEMVAQR